MCILMHSVYIAGGLLGRHAQFNVARGSRFLKDHSLRWAVTMNKMNICHSDEFTCILCTVFEVRMQNDNLHIVKQTSSLQYQCISNAKASFDIMVGFPYEHL